MGEFLKYIQPGVMDGNGKFKKVERGFNGNSNAGGNNFKAEKGS